MSDSSITTALSPQPVSRIRVAVVCDYLEEQWPSMELVGNMLASHLAKCCVEDIQASQVCPRLHRRASRIPLVPAKLARNIDRLVNRFNDYSAFLQPRHVEFDLFHIVDHSYSHLIHSLPPNRTVVTCHDLDTFRCLLEPDRDSRPCWFRAMARRILDGFQKAAHIIAVSAATRDEILRFGLFRAEDITVISNGVHPVFTSDGDQATDAAAASLIRANASGPRLLSVGSTLPRKRIDVLLKTFAAVHRVLPAARLIRIGGFTHEQRRLAEELGVNAAVISVPFLEVKMLAAVYRRCDLLLQTSEAEGFGLPLIESMACGCPVLASGIPVLREVGGQAAAYCPVADVDAWAQAVIQLLTEKAEAPSAWELRRARSVAHAGAFSWAANARETARIYKDVLQHANA